MTENTVNISGNEAGCVTEGLPKRRREPKPTLDPEYIRDLSERVYRIRLEQDCEGNVARMLAKDADKDPEDGGKKLRNRAGQYDPLTRAYLEVLGFKPSALAAARGEA